MTSTKQATTRHDPITLRSVGQSDLAAFFVYLDAHLRDNGANGTPLFQPMARAESHVPPHMRGGFETGLATPLGQSGWRRAWIALDASGAIAGHVDLRARPEAPAAHRALLGMGVHRDHRQKGLGLRLVDEAIGWARRQPDLAWVDLEVLSANAPARRLYARAGFATTGEIADLFRVDGAALAYTYMSRTLSGD
jgi:RimJ/RimL family protein N-acetyltransferase